MNFDWTQAAISVKAFGGETTTLHVQKTGLPFFDTLRLYGAIDLFIGLREDVDIRDKGSQWIVEGQSRKNRVKGRDARAFTKVWPKKKPNATEYCEKLKCSLIEEKALNDSNLVDGRGEWDAALQDGIRGVSARAYETLQSGQTSKKECKASVPLADAVLAFAGKKRTEVIGDVIFLPIFEGRIDLSKVISPVRAHIGPPQVVPAQALVLLMLKTALFAEGYVARLKGVVFSTEFDSRKRDNSSGFVSISPTAIGQIESSDLVSHLYRVFLALMQKAWSKGGKTTEFYLPLMTMTYWLMQPLPKHLSAMITSQEILQRENLGHVFASIKYVKEVFDMTHQSLQGIDHEAVRKFAKAVASAIYSARMAKQKDFDSRRKAWYDEVALLRSAPSARAFREKALILLEQGHREYSTIGTVHRLEDFDPQALLAAIGNERGPRFEAFRDLFRMYLIQASTYEAKNALEAEADGSAGEEIDNQAEVKE